MPKLTKIAAQRKATSLVIIALVLAISGYFLISSHAAQPSAAINAGSSTPVAPAQLVTDSTASAGRAIQFKAAVTPPGNVCSSTDPNQLFCDDFNGTAGSAPDSKWSILTGASGWGKECWSSSPNHIQVDGSGNLKETVSLESGCGRSYTSGGLQTNGFYIQAGDKVDIRAQAACGGGVWPALWTSTGNNGPSWPNSGEIDILEIMDGDQFNAQQTIHGGPNSNSWQINLGSKSSTRWCETYHIYSVQWQPTTITFSIDNKVTHVDTSSQTPSGQTWPFDKGYNNRILMDLQIGNTGGNINDADLPSSMLIDYIKVTK